MGISTGGSIAQQFAIDHPQLVRRLVLVASACRLGPGGRRMQRELARFTLAGQPRRAWAATGPELATTPVGSRLYAALLWLAGPKLHPEDPSDMLVVIDAEDRFNAAPGLHRITAPTLVIAGDRDRNYTPELFRETAEGIPGARLRLYPGKGHASIATLTHKPAVREILGFLTDQPTPPHSTEHNGAGNTEEPVGKAEADEVCWEPLDLPVTMPKVPANKALWTLAQPCSSTSLHHRNGAR